MIEVVKTKELNIIPADHERTWFDWIEGLRDWCISRQIWWGHRCPAYVVSIDGKELDSRDEKSWVIGRNEQEAKQKASVKFNVPFEAITLR
jgi:valyl-tRNA synthetase